MYTTMYVVCIIYLLVYLRDENQAISINPYHNLSSLLRSAY